MSTIQLSLPESVLDEARRLASKDKISLDYYVALVLTRHMALTQGTEYLKQRAKGASRERFLAVVHAAPDKDSDPSDKAD